MAAVWVRTADAVSGNMPPLCARGGVRCITRYRTVVADIPGWLEWLTWSSVWPWLRLRRGGEHTARPARLAVVLPLLPLRRARGQALRTLRDASALGSLALVAAALPLSGTPAGIALRASGVLLAVHLLVALLGLGFTIGTRLDATGHWLRLSRVHPAFAAAAEHSSPRPPTTPQTRRAVRSAARAGGHANRTPGGA